MSEESEREKRFKKMGIPVGAGKVNEGATISSAPRNKFEALEALKRGAKKDTFKELIHAKGQGADGFQIPEAKAKKRHPNAPGQAVSSKHKVEIDSVAAPRSNLDGDLGQIAAMFDESTSAVVPIGSTNQPIPDQIISQPLGMEYSAGMPNFNPLETFKQKMSEKRQAEETQAQPNTAADFDKVMPTPSQEFDEKSRAKAQDDFKRQQEPTLNYYHMKDMITDIATEIAEKKIMEILESYAKKQKKQNMYEIVNKEKNIVKINNKYFQLKEVQVKKRS